MVSQKIRNTVASLQERSAGRYLDRETFALGMQVLLSLADEVECMEETAVPPRHRYTGQDGVIDLIPFLKAHGCAPLPPPPARGDVS
jgi:hypothetical protein